MTVFEPETKATDSFDDFLNELDVCSGFVATRKREFWGDLRMFRHRTDGRYFFYAWSVEGNLLQEAELQGPFPDWASAVSAAVLFTLAELWEAKADLRALRDA